MHVVPYMGYTHPTDILITEIQFNQHRFHTQGIMLTKYPAPIPHTGNHAHQNIQHRFHTLGIMLTKISSTDSTHWESCSPKYSAPIPHTGNHAHQNIQHRFHTLGIMLTILIHFHHRDPSPKMYANECNI